MKDEKSDPMYVIGSTGCHMVEVRKLDEGNKKNILYPHHKWPTYTAKLSDVTYQNFHKMTIIIPVLFLTPVL